MKPLLLLSRGDGDADFLYACRFPVERSLYLRFDPADDLLVVPPMEVDRARREGRARRIVDRLQVGWVDREDELDAWSELAARLLAERGARQVRVSPLLPVAAYEALRAAGLEPEIDRRLFREERRRKSPEEGEAIHAAQEAAEAACVEIVGQLAAADPRRPPAGRSEFDRCFHSVIAPLLLGIAQ